MKFYIYAIKNLINNKIYIGSTKSFQSRKYFHFYQLKHGTHHSSHLQKAYDKYGKEQFAFELIEENIIDNRKDRELYYINLYNSFDRKCGYNIYEPNDNKFKCSQETKNKIQQSEHHTNLSIGIDVYDLSGNFISTHSTVNSCSRIMNVPRGIIFNILDGVRKSYKNKTFILKGMPFNYIPSKKQRDMSKYHKQI